jgi:hypothetical protein
VSTVLSLDQLGEHIARHQNERGFIEGRAARQIFRSANIRQWPERSAPHLGRSEGNIVYDPDWMTGEPNRSEVRPHETLHTSQQHLHGPTLMSLVTARRDEEEHPVQVYSSRRGHQWIEEGHHRLVASRLQGYGEEAEIGQEYHR